MPVRLATAVWEGALKNGKGRVRLGSGLFEQNYSASSRFEEGPGTNPEELLAAAHAGCFSMALAGNLAQAGFTPKRISTTAQVSIALVGAAFRITGIVLSTECEAPGLAANQFLELAEKAKTGCPVSVALAATKIELNAKLVS